jgi:hypothetical protein
MVVMEGGAAHLVLGPGKGKRTWLGKYSSMALIPIFEGREAMIRVVTVGRKKPREKELEVTRICCERGSLQVK